MDDQRKSLSEARDAIPLDSYQDFVSEGIALREAKDYSQWELGKLAARVEAKYGEASIKSYANDINIGYSTLTGYRRIVLFYLETPEAMESASRVADCRDNPMLAFTHFRYAMRLGAILPALSFLDECIDGAWCTDLAYAVLSERLGKPPQPHLVGAFESAESAIRYLKSHPGNYTVKVYEKGKVKHATA